MGYWKSKVLPKIKKILNKNASKKSAAADEAIKAFHHSKDQVNEQFKQQEVELQPKVLQIYQSLPPEIKALIKEPKEADLKNNSSAILKFLQDLANIEFPGSKAVWEACSNLGPASVSEPVIFIFDKVSTLTVREEAEGASDGATNEEKEAVEISTEEKELKLPKVETDIELEATKPADLHPNP